MGNKLAITRQTLLMVLPFVLLHGYVANTYQLSSWQVLQWWFSHYSDVDTAWGYVFIFLFMFFLFFAPFTGVINTTYLAIFGKKHALVYLGHPRESTALFYEQGDVSKQTFSNYDMDRKFNLDFNDIYKLKYFITDPGTRRMAGSKRNRFHPYAILSGVLFTACFSIPFFGSVHALSYPAYQELYTNSAVLQGESMEAFDILLNQYGLTRASAAIAAFGCLLLALIFTLLIPKEKTGRSIQSLPAIVHSGNSLRGKPLGLTIKYNKVRNSNDSHEYVDSGFRYATFEFADRFEPAVYVSMYFDRRALPQLYSDIKQAIQTGASFPLHISDALTLEPDADYSPILVE